MLLVRLVQLWDNIVQQKNTDRGWLGRSDQVWYRTEHMASSLSNHVSAWGSGFDPPCFWDQRVWGGHGYDKGPACRNIGRLITVFVLRQTRTPPWPTTKTHQHPATGARTVGACRWFTNMSYYLSGRCASAHIV